MNKLINVVKQRQQQQKQQLPVSRNTIQNGDERNIETTKDNSQLQTQRRRYQCVALGVFHAIGEDDEVVSHGRTDLVDAWDEVSQYHRQGGTKLATSWPA